MSHEVRGRRNSDDGFFRVLARRAAAAQNANRVVSGGGREPKSLNQCRARVTMASMGRLAVVSVLGVACVFGCGGRTLEDPLSASLLPDGGQRTSVNVGNPGKNPNATDSFDGTVQLPDCKLGFEAAKSPGSPCPYITAGRCYSTKIAACACACPERAGTACASGFPDSRNQVLVTCS